VEAAGLLDVDVGVNVDVEVLEVVVG